MGAAPSKETISLFSYFRGSYEVGLIPLTRYYFGKDDEDGKTTEHSSAGSVGDVNHKAVSSHSRPVPALLQRALLDLVNDEDSINNSINTKNDQGAAVANTVTAPADERVERSEGSSSSDDDEPHLPVFCLSDTDSDEGDVHRSVAAATTTRSTASKLTSGAPLASLSAGAPHHDSATARDATGAHTNHRVQRQLLRAQLIQMRHDPAVRYTNARSRANMLHTLRQHLSGASPQSSLPPMELNKPVEEVTDDELEPYLERYFWDIMPESDFTEDDLDHFLDLVDEALYDTDEAMVKDAYYDAGSSLGVCAGVEAGVAKQRRFMPIPCALCLAYPEGKERSGCFALDGRNINIIGYFGLLTAEMQRAFKVSKCGATATSTTTPDEPAIGRPGSCFPLRGDLALHLNTAILTSAGDRTLERVLVLAAVMFRQQFHTACRRAYLSRILSTSTAHNAVAAPSVVNSSNNSSFSVRSAWLRSGALDAVAPDAQEQLRLLMQPIGPSTTASTSCGLGSIGQCLAPPFLAAATDSGNPIPSSPAACPNVAGSATRAADLHDTRMSAAQPSTLTVPNSVASNALTPLSPSSPPHSDPLFARPLPSLPTALHEQTPTYQANLDFYAEANLDAARSAIPSHTQLYHSLNDGIYQLANDNLPLLPQEEEERIVWAFYRRLQRIALVIQTSSINYSSLKSLTENFAFLHCQVPIDPAGAYMDLIDLPDHSAYSPAQAAIRSFTGDCVNYARRAAMSSEATSPYTPGERNVASAYALSMRSAVVIYMQPAYFCQATLWASCLFHYPSRLPGGQWIQYKLKDECIQLRQILQSKDTLIADWRRVNQSHASRYLGPKTQRLLAHVQCLQEETERARNLPMEHWNHTHVFLNKDGRKYALHRSPYGTMLIGVRVYNGGGGAAQLCGGSGMVGSRVNNGQGGVEYHHAGCTPTHLHIHPSPRQQQQQQQAAYALCYPPGNMYGGTAGCYAAFSPGGHQAHHELAEYDPSGRTPGLLYPSVPLAPYGGREEGEKVVVSRSVHPPAMMLPVNGTLSAAQLNDMALAYAAHQRTAQPPSTYLVAAAALPPQRQPTVAVTPALGLAGGPQAHTPSQHDSTAGGFAPTMATTSGLQLSRQTTSLASTEQSGVRVSLALPPYSSFDTERGAVPHVAAVPSLTSSAVSSSAPNVSTCLGNGAGQKVAYQHASPPCSRGMPAAANKQQPGPPSHLFTSGAPGVMSGFFAGAATQVMLPSSPGQQQQRADVTMVRHGGNAGPMMMMVSAADGPQGGLGGGSPVALPVPRHCIPALNQTEVPVIIVGEAGRRAEAQARAQASNESAFLRMSHERDYSSAAPGAAQSPVAVRSVYTTDGASGQRRYGLEGYGGAMHVGAPGHIAAPMPTAQVSPLHHAHAASSSSSGSPPCVVAASSLMTKPTGGCDGRANAMPPQYRTMPPTALTHIAANAAQPFGGTSGVNKIDYGYACASTPLLNGDRGMHDPAPTRAFSPPSQPRQAAGLTAARLGNYDAPIHVPHNTAAETCIMTRVNVHDGKTRVAVSAANDGVFATPNGRVAQSSLAWMAPRTSQQVADFTYLQNTR